MKKLKNKMKSIRVRLFSTFALVIVSIILLLIIINSMILEDFYLYSKIRTVKEIYNAVNNYYVEEGNDINIEEELNKMASKNAFEILIKTNEDIIIFSSENDLVTTITEMRVLAENKTYFKKQLIYTQKDLKITKVEDRNGVNYLLATSKLSNDYMLYTRIPLESIKESVNISNNVLILIGAIMIGVSAVIASVVSKRFTAPIMELNNITNKMSRLDFSQKYKLSDRDDEINELGKNINTMSQKLENTISQLHYSNIELEKDIKEKSRIDEMRTQFISDVSHELKTPIALIQGYAEGLIENVNSDEESRKFYAEVILDESIKMDKLVKQLLELMKLEYGEREFHNEEFNICELVNEVIRKCNVIIKENKIDIEVDEKEKIMVNADQVYMEQVFRNYLTNAIKNCSMVDNKKLIKVRYKYIEEKNKLRIYVFNTGENIKEEDIQRIWERFYKVDSSRNREVGGSGIGLSLVKAIMDKYNNEYGVANKENGVEFYFDINC